MTRGETKADCETQSSTLLLRDVHSFCVEAEAEAEARNQKQMYLDSSFVNVCFQCQDPAGFHPFIKVVVALIRLLCIFSLLL